MSALPPEKASSVAARPCLRPCLVLLVLPSAPFPRTKADDGSVLANARDRNSVNMALPRRCPPPDDNAIAVCMWGVEYSQRRCTVVKSQHLSVSATWGVSTYCFENSITRGAGLKLGRWTPAMSKVGSWELLQLLCCCTHTIRRDSSKIVEHELAGSRLSKHTAVDLLRRLQTPIKNATLYPSYTHTHLVISSYPKNIIGMVRPPPPNFRSLRRCEYY